jgi:hypothetical protein
MNRAGRQLLVTLREITEGRGFDEIVLDEYHHIPSLTARNAYLYVCSLFQFGYLLTCLVSRGGGRAEWPRVGRAPREA